MNTTNRILVILTGGTICSTPNEDGKNQSDADSAKSYLISDFENSDSVFAGTVKFDIATLTQDILSENMIVTVWNELLELFRASDLFSRYAGVIVLHGTDTLAYTSSLLSMVLAGSKIPVCMVSAQLPLMKTVTLEENGVLVKSRIKEQLTNGYANFRAAVELILNGIAPNVYAVYRNVCDEKHTPGAFLVHFGAHLLQCPNHSNNFHSVDEMTIPDENNAKLAGAPFQTDTFYLNQIEKLSEDVLLITPYIGLDYSRLNISGLNAIVHGTYHSDTVCVERKSKHGSYGKNSVLFLLDRCKEENIPLFLAPCDSDAYAYASTGDAIGNGAWYISNTTLETAYAKTIVGCSLNKFGKELNEFLKIEIDHEFAYKRKTAGMPSSYFF